MNIRKLAEKTKVFLDSDERKRREKRKFLKHVIKKLNKHEKTLIKKMECEADDSKRPEIEAKIALTHAQRKKGLSKLEELKKNPKTRPED